MSAELCLTLCVTPQTVTLQASLSMGYFRQEYWSELPFPPSGDPPNPGMEPMSSASPALTGSFFTSEPPGKPKIKLSDNLKCWQECWETGSLVYCWWEWKMFSHSGKQSGGFLRNKTCNYHMTQKLCSSASERWKFLCPPKPIYHVHRSFIHSSQTVEANQMLLIG